MDDLSETMGKTSLSGEEAVDTDMVSELLRMMQTQKLSALSVDDLVKHLATIKVSKQSSSPVPTKSAPPETPEDMGSPAFSFKSPDAVFTPFKMKETTGKKGKKDLEKSFHFGSNSGSDNENTEGGPFSSQQEQSKASGFHSTSRENAHKASRPSTADNGLFANAGLNSIGAASNQFTNGVQFNIGGSSKSSKRNGNKTTTAKDQHGKTFTFTPSQRAAAQGFADPSEGNSSSTNGTFFWGGQSASSNLPNSYSNPVYLDGTAGNTFSTSSNQTTNTKNVPEQQPATTTTAGAPLPFTFTIGSDGTTTKNKNSSTTASKTAAAKASTSTGPFTSANSSTTSAGGSAGGGYTLGSSDLLDATRSSRTTTNTTTNNSNNTTTNKSNKSNKTTTKQTETPSANDTSTNNNMDTAYTGDGASFTVYTLGEGDVLHSLNEYSSDDTQSVHSNINDPVDPTMDVYSSSKNPTSGSVKADVFGSDGEGEFHFSPDDIPDLPEGMDTSFDTDSDSGDALQESFNNLDQSSRTTASASFNVGSSTSTSNTTNKGPFSALHQSDIPVFTFPVTPFPAATANATPASAVSTASANGGAKNITSNASGTTAGQFLFNGQSMAASQSQFEKENFNFTFPAATTTGATTAPTAATTSTSTIGGGGGAGVGIQYDEDVARRIAEAFSNISSAAPKAKASTNSAGAATAPKVTSVPVTAMPTTTATPSAGTSSDANPTVAPGPTPVFAFPNVLPSASATATGSTVKATPEVPDLASVFKGFNIGAPDKSLGSSKTTTHSAKKGSPVKAKVNRSGGISNTSSNDNAGFSSKTNSAGVGVNSEFNADEAPAWWKEARAAGMQTGEWSICCYCTLLCVALPV